MPPMLLRVSGADRDGSRAGGCGYCGSLGSLVLRRIMGLTGRPWGSGKHLLLLRLFLSLLSHTMAKMG